MSNVGKVYLVGAGCGAADLITVRGQRLLSQCDTVVYDDLIDPALLSLVPERAERIYMGKRSGHHSASQEEICGCLIREARTGKTIVRLKGGDPFVFGRGGEEMLALLDAGVPCEVVPGVTSAIAIPAEAGIPVTHRKLSRSVHIITAHTADTVDGLPEDMNKLAGLSGTLVFLMGLRQLPKIADRLIAAGMSPDTGAAVISGGNSPHPAAVRGTLGEIAEKAQNVQPPAVIVVGEVAAMELRQPLSGVCVAITGTDAVLQKQERLLEKMGANVICGLRSVVQRLSTPIDFEAFLRQESWLVFTSANGVDAFFGRLRESNIDLRQFFHCRFAVIGAATEKKLRQYGIQADLCPQEYTGEALGKALLETVMPGTPVYLLRSVRGGVALREMLEMRFPVVDIPLYDLCADQTVEESAASRLGGADYLTFSSASGVELFFKAHGGVPENTKCVCIGEVTANALRRRHQGEILVAGEATVEAMVETILQAEKL